MRKAIQIITSTDVIKYLTLEKIIKDISPKIILVNSNSRLNYIISHYCSIKGIEFKAEMK